MHDDLASVYNQCHSDICKSVLHWRKAGCRLQGLDTRLYLKHNKATGVITMCKIYWRITTDTARNEKNNDGDYPQIWIIDNLTRKDVEKKKWATLV